MELFSPEARLVLRLGHKFAIESELKSSLKLLAEATYEAFAAKFNASNRRSTSLPATTTQLTFTRQPSNDGNTTLQWAMSSDTNRESGIDGWKRSILRDIELIEEPKRSKLDLLVLKGIRDLRKLPIVLKQADKNLGLVPIHTHIYEQMVLTHLNDRNTYRIAPYFPVQRIRYFMTTIMDQSRIPEWKRIQWMQHATDDARPADFYAMPKIHKRKLFVTRPIAAQHSYILAPLSKALATELLKVQDTLPTIAKDSKTTAKELDAFTFGMVDTEPSQTPSNAMLLPARHRQHGIFLTYDVVAMYPNIPLQDAINVLLENIPALKENSSFWGRVLKLVMMFSFVAFNGKVYHQICGTAMGTPVAPQFANLYFYYKFKHILEDDAILFQRRFIDDGFVIIKSQADAMRLRTLMQENSAFEFTFDISEQEAIFLDFHIYKGTRFEHENKLDFRPYFKPTNMFLYLPYKSNHPAHMKLSIIKGEAIRTLRNSTSKSEWLDALSKIFCGLLSRGYKPAEIQNKFRLVRWEDRYNYLIRESNKDTRPDGILSLTTYHRYTKPIWRKLIDKHNLMNRLSLRSKRFNLRQLKLQELWPPIVVYKDFTKIGHHLIRANTDPQLETGIPS